jgi:hypothetical protein
MKRRYHNPFKNLNGTVSKPAFQDFITLPEIACTIGEIIRPGLKRSAKSNFMTFYT